MASAVERSSSLFPHKSLTTLPCSPARLRGVHLVRPVLTHLSLAVTYSLHFAKSKSAVTGDVPSQVGVFMEPLLKRGGCVVVVGTGGGRREKSAGARMWPADRLKRTLGLSAESDFDRRSREEPREL